MEREREREKKKREQREVRHSLFLFFCRKGLLSFPPPPHPTPSRASLCRGEAVITPARDEEGEGRTQRASAANHERLGHSLHFVVVVFSLTHSHSYSRTVSDDNRHCDDDDDEAGGCTGAASSSSSPFLRLSFRRRRRPPPPPPRQQRLVYSLSLLLFRSALLCSLFGCALSP